MRVICFEFFSINFVLRGACGEVRLAFVKGSCDKFACKIISKKKFSVGGTSAIVSKQQTTSLYDGVCVCVCVCVMVCMHGVLCMSALWCL